MESWSKWAFGGLSQEGFMLSAFRHGFGQMENAA